MENNQKQITELKVTIAVEEAKLFLKKGIKPTNKKLTKLAKTIISTMRSKKVISTKDTIMAKMAIKKSGKITDSIISVLSDDDVMDALKEYMIVIIEMERLIHPKRKEMNERINLLREEDTFKRSLVGLTEGGKIEAIMEFKRTQLEKEDSLQKYKDEKASIDELMNSVTI